MRLFLCDEEGPEAARLLAALGAERRLVIEAGPVMDEAGLGRLCAEADLYDVLLLAEGAPGIDAVAALRALRRAGRKVPVAVLARSRRRLEEAYRAGADEFLVRPVALPELLCRLDALVRRRFGFASPEMRIGDLTIFLDGSPPVHAGVPLRLDARLRETLACLARHAGRVVSREALHAALYGHGHEVGTEVVKVHVCRLRQRLAAAGIDRGLVETVAAGGYRLRSA